MVSDFAQSFLVSVVLTRHCILDVAAIGLRNCRISLVLAAVSVTVLQWLYDSMMFHIRLTSMAHGSHVSLFKKSLRRCLNAVKALLLGTNRLGRPGHRCSIIEVSTSRWTKIPQDVTSRICPLRWMNSKSWPDWVPNHKALIHGRPMALTHQRCS